MIELSEKEEELIQLLEGLMESQKDSGLIIRVAGGWVRDKLLQRQSDDIDLTANNITGLQLAQLLKQYAESKGIPVSSLGVIAQNPEQSKHLETACLKLFGLDLDLCHLRSNELYTEDSRIPTVSLGDPLSDAQRRDFTINALFYNIKTRTVEDLVGGTQDLHSRVLRTPLDPTVTFQDDPLRILRAIRFGVRFQTTFHQALVQAAHQHAPLIRHKVSRERVGKELEGMLSGKHARPAQALKLLCDWGLVDIVFALPDTVPAAVPSQWYTTGYERVQTVEALLEKHQTCLGGDAIHRRHLILATFFLELRHLEYPIKKKKTAPVVSYIVKESIKFPNKDTTAVTSILEVVEAFVVEPLTRKGVGLLLRKIKELWKTALMASSFLGTDVEAFLGFVERELLDECWTTKPLINGKELTKELGIKGPAISQYILLQMEFMLENPNTSREETLTYLKKRKKDQ